MNTSSIKSPRAAKRTPRKAPQRAAAPAPFGTAAPLPRSASVGGWGLVLGMLAAIGTGRGAAPPGGAL